MNPLNENYRMQKEKKEPAHDSGIRIVCHRRISRTIHGHLIVEKVRQEKRGQSMEG